MNIVNRFFPAADMAHGFYPYVKAVIEGADWKAGFITRHNTGSPNLAQRPGGLTEQHIQNLKGYYSGLGWHAGPAAFVDDHGIWVFSGFASPGVHSPSWNQVSYGIEMLGDYTPEDFGSGRGLAVHRNAVAVFACVSKAAGIDSHSMRDHREDPATTHKDCPGNSAHDTKSQFMDEVHAYILAHLA